MAVKSHAPDPSLANSAKHAKHPAKSPASQAEIGRTDQVLLAIVRYALFERPAQLSRASEHASEQPVPSTPELYEQLVAAFGFQGISDAAVRSFAELHGGATWTEVDTALSQRPACPKLTSHWHFADCGFRRSAGTCNRPDLYPACPLPELPLRRGSLNQTAYSLLLFMRDVCGGDLVAWIDQRLEAVPTDPNISYGQRLAEAITTPMTYVHGVSRKVVNMAFADLLLSMNGNRPLWCAAGANMIAVDTLVHNLLHRTGSLHARAAEHAYGSACYLPGRCADIVRDLAGRIDAQTVCSSYPPVFPRLIQHALWRFGAQTELDICNGNQINDLFRCEHIGCPIFSFCERLVLRLPSIGSPNENKAE